MLTPACPRPMDMINDFFFCASKIGLPEDLSVIEVILYYYYRAVANGPVGPAMAGPIIEPANFILIFLIFLLNFFGRDFFRYYFLNR